MFVVFGILGAAGAAARRGLGQPLGFVWFPLTVALAWGLGQAVSRWFSEPANR